MENHLKSIPALTEKEQAILLHWHKPDSERNRYPNPKWDTWEDKWRRAEVTSDEGLQLFSSLTKKGFLQKDELFVGLTQKAQRWIEDHLKEGRP